MRLRSGFFVGCLLLLSILHIHPIGDSYVIIDKSDNTLTYYAYKQPIKTFKVGTGKLAADTPNGTFPVVMMVKKPWWLKKNIPGGDPKNPLGSRWIGLEVPGTDGSIYGIHGTNQPESIGKHVSAGCVRMNNQDVEWLYEHVHVGTVVDIID